MFKRGINIKIIPSKKKDDLQNNINNISSKFLLKFWKPKFNIEEGIDKIIIYYKKKF